jgi:serine/threonine protein kinase
MDLTGLLGGQVLTSKLVFLAWDRLSSHMCHSYVSADAEFFQLHQTAPFRVKAGTRAYMAPEVLSGSYGFEADVFSCGVAMYFLLTGKVSGLKLFT